MSSDLTSKERISDTEPNMLISDLEAIARWRFVAMFDSTRRDARDTLLEAAEALERTSPPPKALQVTAAISDPDLMGTCLSCGQKAVVTAPEPHVLKQIEHAMHDLPEQIGAELRDYITGAISDYRQSVTKEEPRKRPHSAWYQGLRGYDCHTCGAFSATLEGTKEIERDCAKQCISVIPVEPSPSQAQIDMGEMLLEVESALIDLGWHKDRGILKRVTEVVDAYVRHAPTKEDSR